MHEYELGIWKHVFTHLIRMLYTYGSSMLAELNCRYECIWLVSQTNTDKLSRYCQISPFGCSTIRKFRNDVSTMKNLAARDFEDLLQVFHVIILFLHYIELSIYIECWPLLWRPVPWNESECWQLSSRFAIHYGLLACLCKITRTYRLVAWRLWWPHNKSYATAS